MQMSSYASIVKVGVQPLTQEQITEMVNDPSMQASWGDLIETEKKTPRTKPAVKDKVTQKKQNDYVSDLYKEHPVFPLSPIKSIQEKQVKMLQQKSGITIIKRPDLKKPDAKKSVINEQKVIKEPLLSSPSDPKPVAFVTEVQPAAINHQVQESVMKIRTHNPTEEELFGNTSSTVTATATANATANATTDNKKENSLISAYDATIKLQQKEIADNAEVIENMKHSMKEYSKGINTNQSNIATQQQTISDNIEKISKQKDEIINLTTQVNTLRSSFEYYTNELNKVYVSWQQYSNAVKGVQMQFAAESQKNQELIQQNAELEQQVQALQEQEQQLIAYNQQIHIIFRIV